MSRQTVFLHLLCLLLLHFGVRARSGDTTAKSASHGPMSALRASRSGVGDMDSRPLLGNASLLPGEALNEDPEDRIAVDSDTDSIDSSNEGGENEPEDEDALDNAAFRKPKSSSRSSFVSRSSWR